eukprot:TRINITY_DN1176_c0_g1_i2.p1 TRINITY_DN1176_c0_g1~~TRINITY_DN1176_c0_g1_i2.p1  ORF type:complete len:528 (+),score=188.08 TRINITY_DN1176_c0_g1_i2:63-1646(+)
MGRKPQPHTPLVDEEDGQSVHTQHPDETPSWGMYVSVLPALSGPFLFGYCLGFTSPAFSSNKHHWDADKLDSMMSLTSDQITWFGSVIALAAGVGSLVCGWPVDRFGKKMGMLTANLLMLVGFVVLIATPVVVPKSMPDSEIPGGHRGPSMGFDNTKQVVQLCGARVIMGLANGFVCVTSAAYMSELATLKLRGVLGAFFQNAVVGGIVSSYLVGMFTNWQGMSYFAIGVAVMGLLTSFIIPESPQWLVSKGRDAEAEQSLRRMRSSDTDIKGLLDTLRAQVEVRRQSEADVARGSLMTELCQAPRGKALLIGVGLMATAQLNGISAVAAYASQILGQVWPTGNTANSFAFYGQLIKLTVTVFASSLMAKFPRRYMLAGSLSGMIASCFCICLYFFDDSLPAALVMVGYVGYLVSFAMGTGALSWLMLGEIFHPNVRATASAICTAWNWLLTFYISKTINVYKEAFGGGDEHKGMGCVFAMYGGCACLGLLFALCCLPETLGKSYKHVERDMLGRAGRSPVDDLLMP